MNNKPTMYFYQNKKITTIKSDNHASSVLRSNEAILAERPMQTPNATRLYATSESGSVLRSSLSDSAAHNYSAYGHGAMLNSSMFAFNGEMWQQPSAKYLLGDGYRLYSPAIMRFLSPDILSPFGEGGINPFNYCGGDPINYTDPSGAFRIFFKTRGRPRVPKALKKLPPPEHEPSSPNPPLYNSIDDELPPPSYISTITSSQSELATVLPEPKKQLGKFSKRIGHFDQYLERQEIKLEKAEKYHFNILQRQGRYPANDRIQQTLSYLERRAEYDINYYNNKITKFTMDRDHIVFWVEKIRTAR
ncbi:RHS repeat-associated core domain-containing protein [Pseudomonas sp. S32]|uniref:RHS repeat-associated core domain-containing protein n=1 Tax=Pseudomonas sp. S32 TaxID=2767448 RepID=UPI00191303EC|nr:RHS repeat-associated core domain-containing protein [Pseudomonas sp. S32]MBK5004471.1 RHS repeat-associated core domain-containing protein [Pseudomonas sp. S32]